MTSLLTNIAGWNLKRRMKQIEHFMQFPVETQAETLRNLLRSAAATEWGIQYAYHSIETIPQFQTSVPISTYEQLFPYIEKMLRGEEDILWHGGVSWFAKSSGTSNDKSKFIPITDASLHDCHYRAGRDLIALYLQRHKPDSQLFSGKILTIGGSCEISTYNKEAKYGDLSAVLLENLPVFYDWIRSPSKKVALMSNWEEKLEEMCEEIIHEDIRAIVGVPTWTLLLLYKIVEKKGISTENLSSVWPNLEAFFHGGVNFSPYKSTFESLFQHPISFLNIYNASEGFFGIQFDPGKEDLLLMLDYGIFYEFIAIEDIGKENPVVITLEAVEKEKIYAIVISTNGGLWRYLIGDTIVFTAVFPFIFRIVGRTQHFINAFGEELMVDNADRALQAACLATNASIKDYTAAPVYMKEKNAGKHQWLIEFDKYPNNITIFVKVLDSNLQQLNTDYCAKRQGSLTLDLPLITIVPTNTFYNWMKKKGKLGGQNKVPRLSNSRFYVESILELIADDI